MRCWQGRERGRGQERPPHTIKITPRRPLDRRGNPSEGPQPPEVELEVEVEVVGGRGQAPGERGALHRARAFFRRENAREAGGVPGDPG